MRCSGCPGTVSLDWGLRISWCQHLLAKATPSAKLVLYICFLYLFIFYIHFMFISFPCDFLLSAEQETYVPEFLQTFIWQNLWIYLPYPLFFNSYRQQCIVLLYKVTQKMWFKIKGDNSKLFNPLPTKDMQISPPQFWWKKMCILFWCIKMHTKHAYKHWRDYCEICRWR